MASRLSDALKKSAAPKRKGPLWQGPAGDGPEGGVTFSLLNKYLGCKEQFRLRVMDGWRVKEGFNPRLDFGTLWHICEEELAASGPKYCLQRNGMLTSDKLHRHLVQLADKFPDDIQLIAHWGDMTAALFPEYIHHWHDHPDVKDREPLLQEQAFDAPYQLPSGRVVRLRGKWDSIDMIGRGKDAGIYIQENKTKSQVDGRKIARQVTFDLQTMLYLIALSVARETSKQAYGFKALPLMGVRYNVIRRPAHKSVESALKKLNDDREAGRIEEWFGRWKIDISEEDVRNFQRTCLNPLLENLLDDYEWWDLCFRGGNQRLAAYDYLRREREFPHHLSRHFRYPYGVYNPLMEGGTSDLDALLNEGSTVGLQQAETLFPELAAI